MSGKEWGNSSFNFRAGGCVWCHPGGGALEYDRAGYRYDGIGGGLGFTGLNPAPGNGDYYVFSDGAFSNKFGASAKGVVETDCMLCHYGERYNNVNRNYCMSKPGNGLKGTAFANGASLGLTGTATTAGEVLTGVKPGQGVNPDCQILGYTDGVLEADKILLSPKKENCANCHFADGSWMEFGPASSGTTTTPLGFTTFQKILKPGTFTDSDTGALNTSTYLITKGKSEFGKRAESINVAHNPDVHIDKGMQCVDCHYLVSGNFLALKDEAGNPIQGPTTVFKGDHQIAKGNNAPDGKNMDELDNTVTCESCHVDWTHPSLLFCSSPSGYCMDVNHDGTIDPVNEEVPNPGLKAHVGFPALHFKKIDCRTCHIPEQNFKKKETVADFSSTPYPMEDQVETGGEFTGIGRGQAVSNKTGIHYVPLRIWACREHGCAPEDMQIIPVTTTMVPVWKDVATGLPYNKRFPKTAAEKLREVMSGTLTPPFSWTLNSPQGGDTALIINTAAELSNMVTILKGGTPPGAPTGFAPLGAAGQIAQPALNLFVNHFNTTHNIIGADPDGTGPIPGALGSGGCTDCHSPMSEFFLRQHEIFEQPAEGGLQMAFEGGTRSLILGTLSYKCPDGSTAKVNLTAGKAQGTPIDNVVSQADALCYTAAEVTALTEPPPPVRQNLGIDDISYANLQELDCRECHRENSPLPAVDDTYLPDRHHLQVGNLIPANSAIPNKDSNVDGIPDKYYDCLNCHGLSYNGGMWTLDQTFRNCLNCHLSTPHHVTVKARTGNCKECHGSFVDRGLYDTTGNGVADAVIQDWIATYDPSLITPWPSKKPNGGTETHANGVKPGNCTYCHDSGVSPEGLVVLNNTENHHLTGFGPPDLLTPGVCFWCHDMLNAATNTINPTNKFSIRVCENCHGIPSLHNIVKDSDGDEMIYPGAEVRYYGHIGNNFDCWGCHGFTSAQAVTGPAPRSGPVVPFISSLSASSIEAGLNWPLTIKGASFVNKLLNPLTGQYDRTLVSSVALTDASGNQTTLTPQLVTDGQIEVTIPSTLAPGAYQVTAVKVDKESNPVVLAVTPGAEVNHVTCGAGGYFLIGGSGFGSRHLDAVDSGTNVRGKTVSGTETAYVVLWTDRWILGLMSSCPDEASVVVSTVFTSAQTASSTGGGKGGKVKRR